MTLVQIAHYTSPNYTNHPQVNIHCIENMFTVQDFWGTCACPENGFCSENFQASGSRPPQKKFAVHLLQKKLLKKIECHGCACFWEPIRLKRGSVVAHHTRISSSIPRSFSRFLVLISASRKSIFTEPWRCKWQDYFDGFDTDHWIGFVSRSPKLIDAVLGKQCLKNGSFCKSISCSSSVERLLDWLISNGLTTHLKFTTANSGK